MQSEGRSTSEDRAFDRILSESQKTLAQMEEGLSLLPALAEKLLILRQALHDQHQCDPQLGDLADLASLDERIRLWSGKLAVTIGEERLETLRNANPDTNSAWWWNIEEPSSMSSRVLRVLAIIALAFSLVVLADVFGRIFLGASDPMTLALQSLLGLFAGASVWQLAKTALNRDSRRQKTWALAAAVATIIILFLVGPLAQWYLDRGIASLKDGRPSSAVAHLTRAQRLQESSLGHFHLGVAREALKDTLAANQAYLEAIALDPSFYGSYNNLARLQLVHLRRPDLALALLEEQEAMEPPPGPLAYLRKNRAWALVNLGHFHSAEQEIAAVRALSDVGLEAALTCLDAQVLDGLEQPRKAESAWAQCHEYAVGGATNIEATWAALAQERNHAN